MTLVKCACGPCERHVDVDGLDEPMCLECRRARCEAFGKGCGVGKEQRQADVAGARAQLEAMAAPERKPQACGGCKAWGPEHRVCEDAECGCATCPKRRTADKWPNIWKRDGSHRLDLTVTSRK